MNYVKPQILDIVDNQGPLKSKDLAQEMCISREYASMQLKRYYEQGLLEREEDEVKNVRDGKLYRSKPYVYRITEQGIERKEYLKEEYGN